MYLFLSLSHLRVKRGEGKAINSQAKENENVSLVFLFICLCRTHKPILLTELCKGGGWWVLDFTFIVFSCRLRLLFCRSKKKKTQKNKNNKNRLKGVLTWKRG